MRSMKATWAFLGGIAAAGVVVAVTVFPRDGAPAERGSLSAGDVSVETADPTSTTTTVVETTESATTTSTTSTSVPGQIVKSQAAPTTAAGDPATTGKPTTTVAWRLVGDPCTVIGERHIGIGNGKVVCTAGDPPTWQYDYSGG